MTRLLRTPDADFSWTRFVAVVPMKVSKSAGLAPDCADRPIMSL